MLPRVEPCLLRLPVPSATWPADSVPGAGRCRGDCAYPSAPWPGARHGEGVSTGPTGWRYEGELREGKPHGQGVMTWTNGTRYEGGWRNNLFHGRGVLTESDGTRYEGEFRDGGVFIGE